MDINDMLSMVESAGEINPAATMKNSKARPQEYFRAKYDGLCVKCGEPYKIGDLLCRIGNKYGTGVAHYWHWVYVRKADRAPGEQRLARPAPWRSSDPNRDEEPF